MEPPEIRFFHLFISLVLPIHAAQISEIVRE
jgi:hypothetical protein